MIAFSPFACLLKSPEDGDIWAIGYTKGQVLTQENTIGQVRSPEIIIVQTLSSSSYVVPSLSVQHVLVTLEFPS